MSSPPDATPPNPDPPDPDPPDTDPSSVPPKPWRRWLPVAIVAAVAGVIAIIIAVASGGDDGTKSGTATTVGDSVAPNDSAATIDTSTGPVSSGASSTTASGTGGPTSSSVSPNPAQSSPAATVAPTPGATTPATATGGATTPPPTTANGAPTPPPTASSPINLGRAADFAALGNTAIGSTGPTKVSGWIGVSNGVATGFTATDNPTGLTIVDSTSATQAQVAADGAVSELDGLTPSKLASADLTTQRIGPGTYSAATLGVSGTVTLDSGGDANALFVFKSESTLTVAAATRIVLAGGAQACNVYWRIGSSATLGSGSAFVGTVIADESITAASGSDITGRLIARNGAVTLDSDSIAISTCA